MALVEKGEQGLALLWTGAAHAEELPRALRNLPRRPQAVVCALSLEHAAIRTLSLPPTTDENLERVIGLEAEAAQPLTSDDYHRFAMFALGSALMISFANLYREAVMLFRK